MGTFEGGTKAHQTLRNKLGPKGYAEHMAAIGAKGGKAKVAKGFSVTKRRIIAAQELHTRLQDSERLESDTD